MKYSFKKARLSSFGLLPFVTIATLLTACQSVQTAPVLMRADNTFETTGLGKTKAAATQNAIAAANKQCGIKKPVIIDDKVTYNGVISEQVGRVLEQGVSVVGSVLGTNTPSLSRDDDYEHFLKFKCQ